jgi:hypothetical protein
MKSRFSKVLAKVREINPERAVFFGGIALASIGVAVHDVGAGISTAGVLMLLSLSPLSKWIK